jgi:hypothetical protein
MHSSMRVPSRVAGAGRRLVAALKLLVRKCQYPSWFGAKRIYTVCSSRLSMSGVLIVVVAPADNPF